MPVKMFRGFHPYSFQRAVLDELCKPDSRGQSKIVIAKSQRQRGKSITAINALLYYAINFSKSKNYFVSPTIKQAKEVYKTITGAIAESGIIVSSNATDLTMKFINGSKISFKSAEQKDGLRGYHCSGLLVVDEAAFIDDSIWYLILPWTDFHHSNVLIISTPFVQSGFFYQYYNYGLEKVNNCITVDWCDSKYDEDMRVIMPPERLEMYRQTLPKNVFLTEYLGQWLQDEGTVFTGFKKCVEHNKIAPGDRLFVGIDWANGAEGDDTVIVAFNQFGKQVYLDYFNNLSPTQQIDRIAEFLTHYKNQIVAVETELNSLGTPLTDFLKNRPQIKNLNYVGFNTTNQSKNTIVTNLQLAFEQGAITILDDEKQLRELGYYTAEVNIKTRTISYNAPRGLHDDICIAMMLAYDAQRNGEATGNYSFTLRTPHYNKGFKSKHKYVGQ